MTRTKELLYELVQQRHRLKMLIDNTTAEIEHLDGLINKIAVEDNRTERELRKAQVPAAMTITALARYLGISKHTIYDLLAEGRLVGRTGSTGRTVILRAEVDQWLAELPVDDRFRRRADQRWAS